MPEGLALVSSGSGILEGTLVSSFWGLSLKISKMSANIDDVGIFCWCTWALEFGTRVTFQHHRSIANSLHRRKIDNILRVLCSLCVDART